MSNPTMTAKLVLETGQFVGGAKLAGNAVGQLNSGLKGLEGQIKPTSAQLEKMQSVAKKQEALAASVRSFEQLTKGLGLAGKEAEKLGKQLGLNGATLKAWQAQAAGADTQALALGKGFKQLAGWASAAALGAGSVRWVQSSLDAFGQYDAALRSLVKVTGESRDEVQAKMEGLNPKLGNLAQLTAGYYQAISAGAKDAVGMLEVASKVSVAAADHVNGVFVTSGDAIKAISKLKAAYGDLAGDDTSIADKLFAIEKGGQTSVGELVPYMGEVGSVASAAKVSVDELGGAIATVTQFAGSTATGMTQLKSLFTEMIKPTGELQKTLKGLGVESGKQLIDQYGLVGALERLKTAAGSKGLIGILGSQEAGQAAEAMLKDMDGLKSKTLEVAQSAGALERSFKAASEGAKAQQVEMQNILFAANAQIGEELMPIRAQLYQDFAKFLTDNKDDLAQFAAQAAELAKALYEVGRVLTSVGPLLVELLVIGKITGLAKGAATAFEGFTIATNGLVGAMTKLNIVAGAVMLAVAAYEGMSEIDRQSKAKIRKGHEAVAEEQFQMVKEHEARIQAWSAQYADKSAAQLRIIRDGLDRMIMGNSEQKIREPLKQQRDFIQFLLEAYQKGALASEDLTKAIQAQMQTVEEATKKATGELKQGQQDVAASPDPAKSLARKEAEQLYRSSLPKGSEEWVTLALQDAFEGYSKVAAQLGEQFGQDFWARQVEDISQAKDQYDQKTQPGGGAGGLQGIGKAVEAFGAPLTEATSAMLTSASSMYNLAMAIPALADAIMGMVTDFLKAWRDLGSKIGNWLKSLPTLLRDAIHGLADLFTEALATLFSVEFWDSLINGFIDGIHRALAQLFGGGERQVTEAQVAALKELTKSIRGWVTDLERADWGPQDWDGEFKRLQSERDQLDRGASDYWDRYIDLSKQQFETLKKIKESTEASRATLQGVLNTLKSTLEQISGAQYNPQLQSLDAKTARFDELLAAAQESGISASERQDRVGQLTGYSTQYLDAAQAQLRSSQGYREVYQAVVAGLQSVQAVTQGELDGLSSSPDFIAQANSLADAVEAPILGPESQGIFQMILDSLKWIGGILTNVQGGINALKSVLEGAAKILSDIWTGLTSLFGALGGMLKTLFKDLGGLISGAWHAIMDVGTAIGSAALNVVNGIWGAAAKVATEVWDSITRAIEKLPGAIYEAIKGLFDSGSPVGSADSPNKIDGNGIKIGGYTIASFSDRRLKENIRYGAEILPGVRQAYWDWNEQARAKGHFGAGAGVIAQDLERILPSLVREVAGYKQVDYAGLAQLAGDQLQVGGYAEGGISYGPQLAWVSEGRYSTEAHVPLPNGKSIPVEIKGGSKEGEAQRLDRLADRLGELIDIQRSIRDKGGPVVVFDLDQMGRSLANQTGERKQRGGLHL